MLYQRFNSAVKVEMHLRVMSQVIKMEKEAGNKVSSFLDSLGYRLKIHTCCRENSFVGQKKCGRAGFWGWDKIRNLGFLGCLNFCLRLAPFVFLSIDFAVSTNLNSHPFRKGIDCGCTHAVES